MQRTSIIRIISLYVYFNKFVVSSDLCKVGSMELTGLFICLTHNILTILL